MLTLETLQKLQLEQEKLDKFIIQSKNLTDSNTKDSFIRTKIALLVEIGELANELKTFKHWKSQKEINWDKAKEELIDCLHFYLSWVNRFQIDFSDYKFQKLVPEPSYNELLLALFSETELFSVNLPKNKLKQKILANLEKSWEESISKYSSERKINQKDIESFQEANEESKKEIEKMGNNYLEAIEEEKNKASFYRWLITFEELAQKIGMTSEKNIEEAYLTKNKINWERQRNKY